MASSTEIFFPSFITSVRESRGEIDSYEVAETSLRLFSLIAIFSVVVPWSVYPMIN